jgi:periodic tryptophan protein 1
MITTLAWIPRGAARPVPLKSERQVEDTDVQDSDDDSLQGSDREDYILRDTDCVLVVGTIGGAEMNEEGDEADENNAIEVQVYDSEEQNLYVHHDFVVPDNPLCVEWIGVDPRDGSKASFAAVGTMGPGIELWNLDMIDAFEPSALLGGVKEELDEQEEQSGVHSVEFHEGSHEDSVLDLSWSKMHSGLLLSASADCTVKLWDLSQAKCINTLNTLHGDKIGCVSWNPAEANLAASSGFDKSISIFNVHGNGKDSMKVHFTNDLEVLAWNHHHPAIIAAGMDNGTVGFYDVRNISAGALAIFKAHGKEISSISFNPLVPNVMATSSHDGKIKVWDLQDTNIKVLAERDMKVGPLFAMKYYPDSKYLLATGGGDGAIAIWDTSENDIVDRRCA